MAGLFIGSTDLLLYQERGPYELDETDTSMMSIIAESAPAANKRWIIPAWRSEERSLKLTLEADCVVFTHE